MSQNNGAISAYPLTWPEGWPRTPTSKRESGRFKVKLDRARRELLEELRMLGATGVILSTAIPLRRDGQPYGSRVWRSGDDPGVAVYFTRGGKQQVIPCDTYTSPEANMRAVGLSVGAMRALDRYGVKGMLDRAFAGFAALPAPDRLDWRAELGVPSGAAIGETEVEARYRRLAMAAHPDRGGSDARMARLTRAREAALREIGVSA
jgi:hypothetical protein